MTVGAISHIRGSSKEDRGRTPTSMPGVVSSRAMACSGRCEQIGLAWSRAGSAQVAWHEAAYRCAESALDRPHHRAPGSIGLGDHGVIGHDNPFPVEPDSIVTALQIPVGIRNGNAIRIRTARPSPTLQAIKPGFQGRVGVAAIIVRHCPLQRESCQGGCKTQSNQALAHLITAERLRAREYGTRHRTNCPQMRRYDDGSKARTRVSAWRDDTRSCRAAASSARCLPVGHCCAAAR
jgi:hypothetical protein